MWKWFVGFVLLIVILKAISSCAVTETQSLKINSPDLSVVPADQLPLLVQNGSTYIPKYKKPEKLLEHHETPDKFQVTEEELMLAPEATD